MRGLVGSIFYIILGTIVSLFLVVLAIRFGRRVPVLAGLSNTVAGATGLNA